MSKGSNVSSVRHLCAICVPSVRHLSRDNRTRKPSKRSKGSQWWGFLRMLNRRVTTDGLRSLRWLASSRASSVSSPMLGWSREEPMLGLNSSPTRKREAPRGGGNSESVAGPTHGKISTGIRFRPVVQYSTHQSQTPTELFGIFLCQKKQPSRGACTYPLYIPLGQMNPKGLLMFIPLSPKGVCTPYQVAWKPGKPRGKNKGYVLPPENKKSHRSCSFFLVLSSSFSSTTLGWMPHQARSAWRSLIPDVRPRHVSQNTAHGRNPAPLGSHGKPLLVGMYRGTIIPGFRRWCRISSNHSSTWNPK